MPLVHPSRLATTLDALAEALFYKRQMPASERNAATKWIAGRQGLPGSYADMFAPTAQDLRGLRLFTGERVSSRAGIAHLLGEEACRVLHALPAPTASGRAALQRAITGMSERLDDAENRGYDPGLYCCGTCSAGYWRNLATGLFPRAEERLRKGLLRIKALRGDDGQWQRFPFYFTSLALIEIGPDLARDEMRHAAPRWHRLLLRIERADDHFARRRAEVGRRLLELCE